MPESATIPIPIPTFTIHSPAVAPQHTQPTMAAPNPVNEHQDSLSLGVSELDGPEIQPHLSDSYDAMRALAEYPNALPVNVRGLEHGTTPGSSSPAFETLVGLRSQEMAARQLQQPSTGSSDAPVLNREAYVYILFNFVRTRALISLPQHSALESWIVDLWLEVEFK